VREETLMAASLPPSLKGGLGACRCGGACLRQREDFVFVNTHRDFHSGDNTQAGTAKKMKKEREIDAATGNKEPA
jgi:hypothetical protein